MPHTPQPSHARATRLVIAGLLLATILTACPNPVDNTVASLDIVPAADNVPIGQSVGFTATARNAGGATINPTPSLNWSSSDTGKATVDATGNATGVSVGTVTINASTGGVTGQATLKVISAPVAQIVVSTSKSSINIDEVLTLTAVAKDANGNTITPTPVFQWTSSNQSAARVTLLGDKLIGEGQGSTNVTASTGGVTSSAKAISVNAASNAFNFHIKGDWSDPQLWSSTLAIHAALMPDGSLVTWGWRETDPYTNCRCNPDAGADPPQNANDPNDFSMLPNPKPQPDTRVARWLLGSGAPSSSFRTPGSDVFGAGHDILPDGRLFVNGGSSVWGEWVGIHDNWGFTASSNSWSKLGNMNRNRWYPTVTTLANGEVLSISGQHDSAEAYNPATNTWRPVRNPSGGPLTPNDSNPTQDGLTFSKWYPFVHPIPGQPSKVFVSGPYPDHVGTLDTSSGGFTPSNLRNTATDPTNAGGSSGGASPLFPTAARPYPQDRSYGAAVPLDDGKVLLVGGSQLIDNLNGDSAQKPTKDKATNTAVLLDIKNNTMQSAGAMKYRRVNLNAVALPNGQVLAVGGNTLRYGGDWPQFNGGDAGDSYQPACNDLSGNCNQMSKVAEAWDPTTNQWTEWARQQIARDYHSTALLLPDGRIFSGGGYEKYKSDAETNIIVNTNRRNVEFFTPPYLYKRDGSGQLAPRPAISSTVTTIGFNKTFDINYSSNRPIEKVSFMRLGSTTHALDFGQRYVKLTVVANTPTRLTVTSPFDGTYAPPGYYMLVILDDRGRPSEAKMVQLK